jgi:hypothetical protein
LAGAEAAADLCTWGLKAPTSPDIGRVNSESVDTSDAVIHVIISVRSEGVVGVGIKQHRPARKRKPGAWPCCGCDAPTDEML